MTCALARFSLHYGIPDAMEVLAEASSQDSEFANATRKLMGFDAWLISIALPAAYHLRDLSNEELHPRIEG
jgi:hypothetical protein